MKGKFKLDAKKIIILIVFVICLGIVFGINYCFFSPSKVNKYIASNMYKTPANSAFSDDNFYQCVVDAYNTKNNASLAYTVSLSDSELQTIEELWCNNKNVKDASGLGKMTSLTNLHIGSNQLTSLNVSKLSGLMYLDVQSNQLTSLDLSNNSNLITLNVSYNQLTSLDLSVITNLTSLNAYSNQLTSLNFTKNYSLNYLNVSNNQLTNLDLVYNKNLTTLNVASNQLTNIDLTNNLNLISLNVANNQLTSLDLSKLSSLTNLYSQSNQLTSLDLSNNSKLNTLNVSNNQFTLLNLENLENLKILDASNNSIGGINYGNVSNLTSLNLANNKLVSINVSGAVNLTSLDVSNNQLTSLDLSKNSNLSNDINIDNNPYGGSMVPMFSGQVYDSFSVLLPSHLTPEIEISYADGNPPTGAPYDIEGNKLKIYYGGEMNFNLKSVNPNYTEIITVDVVDISSEKYNIHTTADDYDGTIDSIFVGDDTDKEIEENITVVNGIIEVVDDYLVVKNDEDTEVKKISLIRVSSSVYDLSNEYIYAGNSTNEEILANITVANASVSIDDDNVLNISYDDIIYKYDLIRVSSDV